MDGGVVVGDGGEGLGFDGVDELPRIGLAGAVGVGVAVGDGAVAVGTHADGGVVRIGGGHDLAAAGVVQRVGHGLGGLASAMDGGASALRDLQCWHHDVEGEGPGVGVSGAVFIRIGVDDVSLAAVEAGAVDGGGARCERFAAGAVDCRQGDAVGGYLRETVDGGLAASVGDGEVLGRHLVGVGPGVVGAVDMIVVDEGGIAAAVVQGARVDAGRQGDGVAAVGDDGQGGGVHLGETMDGDGIRSFRGEGVRIKRDGVGPEGVVTGAVGVAVAEDDRAGAVGIEGGGAVHEDRGDAVAADVGDGVRSRSGDIHEARHGGAVVGGHIGDDVRQLDVEGEGPRGVCTSTVSIEISEGFCTLAV